MMWRKRITILLFVVIVLLLQLMVMSLISFQIFLPLIIGTVLLFVGYREWGYSSGVISAFIFELYSAYPFGLYLLSITFGLLLFDVLMTYVFKQVALYSYVIVYLTAVVISTIPLGLAARFIQSTVYSSLGFVYGAGGQLALSIVLSLILATLTTGLSMYLLQLLRVNIKRI